MSNRETKKKLTQKQLDALARGRAKRMDNIKKGIKTERRKKINTKSDDYLAGVIRGIEMDRRITRLENEPRNNAYVELFDNRGIEHLPYMKNDLEYIPKKLTQKQLDALARGRDTRRMNKEAQKQRRDYYDVVE